MPADPHLRRRPLLARRLASGLPPWAVAHGSNCEKPASPASSARSSGGHPVADLPLAPDAVLTRDELQTLAEIRAMYHQLPEERLRRICATPPKGMEKIFAVLAFENGIGGWPSGP